MKLEDIGDLVSRSEQTVGRWIQDWNTRRMASIFIGHANNENAGKLTKAQKTEIQEVLKNPPSDTGLPRAFWDVPTLRRDNIFSPLFSNPPSTANVPLNRLQHHSGSRIHPRNINRKPRLHGALAVSSYGGPDGS